MSHSQLDEGSGKTMSATQSFKKLSSKEIIDKLATYVRANGQGFYSMILERQKNDPKCGFIHAEHPDHPYFIHKMQEALKQDSVERYLQHQQQDLENIKCNFPSPVVPMQEEQDHHIQPLYMYPPAENSVLLPPGITYDSTYMDPRNSAAYSYPSKYQYSQVNRDLMPNREFPESPRGNNVDDYHYQNTNQPQQYLERPIIRAEPQVNRGQYRNPQACRVQKYRHQNRMSTQKAASTVTQAHESHLGFRQTIEDFEREFDAFFNVSRSSQGPANELKARIYAVSTSSTQKNVQECRSWIISNCRNSNQLQGAMKILQCTLVSITDFKKALGIFYLVSDLVYYANKKCIPWIISELKNFIPDVVKTIYKFAAGSKLDTYNVVKVLGVWLKREIYAPDDVEMFVKYAGISVSIDEILQNKIEPPSNHPDKNYHHMQGDVYVRTKHTRDTTNTEEDVYVPIKPTRDETATESKLHFDSRNINAKHNGTESETCGTQQNDKNDIDHDNNTIYPEKDQIKKGAFNLLEKSSVSVCSDPESRKKSFCSLNDLKQCLNYDIRVGDSPHAKKLMDAVDDFYVDLDKAISSVKKNSELFTFELEASMDNSFDVETIQYNNISQDISDEEEEKFDANGWQIGYLDIWKSKNISGAAKFSPNMSNKGNFYHGQNLCKGGYFYNRRARDFRESSRPSRGY